MSSLVIVIPCFNEEESLPELVEQINSDVRFAKVVEILFVNDGSTDSTEKVLYGLAKKYPHIKVISFQRNFGKALGLQAGFDEMKEADLVATLDADLQDIPAELAKLYLTLKQGTDLVVGWKKIRHDGLSKRLPSKIANGATKIVTGVKIHDMNCGMKLMKYSVAKSLNLYGDLHRYIPALAAANGFSVGEHAVTHQARKYGSSKYGIRRLFSSGFDLFTVLLISKYNSRPLHFFGPPGVLSFILGVIILVVLTVEWLLGASIGDRPLLILGVLLIIFGVQTLSVGLLAEMLVNGQSDKRYVLKR